MSTELMGFEGRNFIVAGAGGGGLGSCVTELLARQGAQVIAVDRTQEKIDADLEPLRSEGLAVRPVLADVQTEAGVDEVMQAARDADGTLHGLVTMVGGGPPHSWAPASEISREVWADMFSKNLESMFFMSQAVAAELQAQELPGSLVSISSISGLGAGPFHIAYATAKGAILPVVRTMALELASSNIRVNAVAPAAMIGPKSLLPENPEREQKAIPMGRQAQHKEVAATILFLLSDMATYMTGQCLTVDGGIGLKGPHLAEDNTPVMITNEDFLKAMKDKRG